MVPRLSRARRRAGARSGFPAHLCELVGVSQKGVLWRSASVPQYPVRDAVPLPILCEFVKLGTRGLASAVPLGQACACASCPTAQGKRERAEGGILYEDDSKFFAAFPYRRLRMREATPEEAGPARPGVRMFAIVARGRSPFVLLDGTS
jgi:hypothetical protein